MMHMGCLPCQLGRGKGVSHQPAGQHQRRVFKRELISLPRRRALRMLLRPVQNKGHPDVKLNEPDEAKAWGFAGPIPSIDALVHVLVTIAWTSSVHHAAVNFGQYDYSGLLLNTSPLMRKPIPDPNNPEDPEYQARSGRGMGHCQEEARSRVGP
jgi:hypothetical protein